MQTALAAPSRVCVPAWSCCRARCTARRTHGFIPQLITRARTKGVSGYIGDGANRWPAVHVKDAATLYRRAVEKAPAGAVLNAVGDEGVPVREIAEAIGRHLDLPARSLPAEDYDAPARSPTQHSTCPLPAPSPRNSWAGSPPTPASSRTSTRATTSSDQL